MPFFVTGEKITLKGDGTWIADGVEISHEQTRDLFFRSIRWDPEHEKYLLAVGYERLYIEVEDTPYFVTSLERRNGETVAKLSNAGEESLIAERLSYTDGKLYLRASDGQRAKFLSAAYYDLLQDLKEDDRYYFLVIGGKRANLATKN